jgi:hypothetical protein
MNGFSELELKNYKYLVYNNVIQATFQIIDGARSLNIDFEENILVTCRTKTFPIAPTPEQIPSP